jgi:3-oxoacyl-[acyl-carrier protein] reductase
MLAIHPTGQRFSMSLDGDVAIVTGSGRGIGSEIARRLAREQARLVIADQHEESAQLVADAINAAGGSAAACRADVTSRSDAERLVAQTIETYGRLDVLVNNAGVGLNKPFLETTLEDWQRVLDVNLTGTFLCSQAAARAMMRQGGGRIVNIASISGQRGAQGRSAYGASKAGVIQLTKVLAVELAEHGIRVNAVAPGPVATDMTSVTHSPAVRRSYHQRIPLRRYCRAEEIAEAVLFLASRQSSFVTGHTLNVDGGFYAAGLMFEGE